MERPIATERSGAGVEYSFFDKAIPERVFNAELRRIDSTLDGITRALERIDAKFDRIDARFDKTDADIRDVRAKVESVDARLWGILCAVVISIIAQIVLRYI